MAVNSWRRAAMRGGVASATVMLVTSLCPSTISVAATAPTRVHYISPTDASGQIRRGYRVTSSHHGYCWTVSSINPGLYRCFRQDAIVDPCWAEAGGESVVCLSRPWSHRLMRLHLTRRLPKTMPARNGLWGLTRESGVGCRFADGGRSWFHGRPVSYLCPRRWVLTGFPDRHDLVWSIRTARRVHGHYEARGRHGLSDAWRAKAP